MATQDRASALEVDLSKTAAMVEQEKEQASRLEAEIEDLKKRALAAGELTETESRLNAQRKTLDTRVKELAQRETALAATEAQVRTRETEAGKVSRKAAERGLEAERNLKAIKERERRGEKAETKFKEGQEKVA